MMARLSWFGAMALMGVAMVCAQLDRASATRQTLSALVPGPFAATAGGVTAKRHLANGDGEQALVAARETVRLRPAPAEALTTLALAYAATGQREPAVAAMEASLQRGWRDPVAQLAAGSAALEAGQYDAAAQRVAALLATGKLPRETWTLFAALARTEEGRQAMARRYAAPGQWQRNTWRRAAQALQPIAFADLALRVRRAGGEVPCQDLREIPAIYRASAASGAARIIADLCPVASEP